MEKDSNMINNFLINPLKKDMEKWKEIHEIVANLKEEYMLENGFVINIVTKEIRIPLRNIWKEIKAWALASLDKLDLLKDYKFNLTRNEFDGRLYAQSGVFSMHELVFGRKAKKGFIIDHDNKDSLDNTNKNLREATGSQNSHSRKKQLGTSSRYMGVSLNKKSGKWKSGLTHKGERYDLGLHKNERDAAFIHDIWDIFLYRDFAVCNIDEKNEPLINIEMKNHIISNGIPKGYERRQRKPKENDFPQGINKYRKGYKVEKKFQRRVVIVYTKTYEEALISLNYIIEREKLRKEYIHQTKIISRNLKGIPYIPVKCRNGKILHFLVSKKCWRDLMRYNWTRTACGKYAWTTDKNKKQWKLHNYIYHYYIGEIKEGYTVDHKISFNHRDNRIENLRLATKSEQSHNTKTDRIMSLPRGVGIRNGKFYVTFAREEGGYFNTVEEAAEKYNQLAIKKFGDMASLNKITTKGTTVAYLFRPEIITLEFLKNIESVFQLQSVLETRKDWKRALRINYLDINRRNLKEYLKHVISYAENNMEYKGKFIMEEGNYYTGEKINDNADNDYDLENYPHDGIDDEVNILKNPIISSKTFKIGDKTMKISESTPKIIPKILSDEETNKLTEDLEKLKQLRSEEKDKRMKKHEPKLVKKIEKEIFEIKTPNLKSIVKVSNIHDIPKHIKEKKTLRDKGINFDHGNFTLLYKGKYIGSYYFEEEVKLEYNRLIIENRDKLDNLFLITNTRTTVADYFANPSIEFIENLFIINELVQVFYFKPEWRKLLNMKQRIINADNFIEYRNLAVKLRIEELKRELKGEKDVTVTLEYIQNITTVEALKELFRLNENWKIESNVTLIKIKSNNINKYKDIAINCFKNELKEGKEIPKIKRKDEKIITLEYIRKIVSVKDLKDLFRLKREWRKENNVLIINIQKVSFETYKTMAIKCLLKETEGLKPNLDYFESFVSDRRTLEEIIKSMNEITRSIISENPNKIKAAEIEKMNNNFLVDATTIPIKRLTLKIVG